MSIYAQEMVDEYQPMIMALCSDENHRSMLEVIENALGLERAEGDEPVEWPPTDSMLISPIFELAEWAVTEAGGGVLRMEQLEWPRWSDRQNCSVVRTSWYSDLPEAELRAIVAAASRIIEERDRERPGIFVPQVPARKVSMMEYFAARRGETWTPPGR